MHYWTLPNEWRWISIKWINLNCTVYFISQYKETHFFFSSRSFHFQQIHKRKKPNDRNEIVLYRMKYSVIFHALNVCAMHIEQHTLFTHFSLYHFTIKMFRWKEHTAKISTMNINSDKSLHPQFNSRLIADV